MSALDTAARFVNPNDVRAALRTSSDYTVNRDRVGALVQSGFDAYDKYQEVKPYIFWGSLVGMALSGFAYWKRGKVAHEAKGVYAASFCVCAAAAWFTRPTTPEVPADAPPGTEATQDSAIIAWVDKKVETLKEQDPNFADKALGRLIAIPGMRERFEKLNPLIRAAVV